MKNWTIKRRNGDTILYVIKDSTGERFYEGDMVWSEVYNKELGPIRFDQALTGARYLHSARYFFEGDWYEGYFRTDSGLYHINELSALVQHPVADIEMETSMLLLA